MAKVTATLSNYRQSPRKVRLIADLVRGKNATAAIAELDFVAKRGSLPIKKLIESALKNAENLNVSKENLIIKEIRVDQGVTLHRMMPRARGRGAPIRKRSSHILVVLDEKISKAKS